jgi:cytochrome c553
LDARGSTFARIFPTRVTQWIGAALAFAVGGLLAAVVVSTSGLVDVSAIPPDSNVLARFLHYSFRRSADSHAHPPATTESLESPAMVMRGAGQYALVCENCHGAPGRGQSPVALAMHPAPPMLSDVVGGFTDASLFYVVQNGVRYTGMPAYPVTNRPDEIWAMVSFLKAMPKMEYDAYARLTHGDTPGEHRSVDSGGSSAPAPTAAAPGGLGAPGAPGNAFQLAAFAPSSRPRPLLPGAPHQDDVSPKSTVSPSTGFFFMGDGAAPTSGCVDCHGAEQAGRRGGEFPNLTLQTPQYLYDALHAYANGQRQSGIMWTVAANLSDTQIRKIAMELGAGAPLPSPADLGEPRPDPSRIARGAAIASAGIRGDGSTKSQGGDEVQSAKVERCSSCHLPGAYLDKVVPRLEGQNAAYIRMQMHVFRGGGRGDTGAYDPMVGESHKLSDADIEAVAAYYASLPPLTKALTTN